MLIGTARLNRVLSRVALVFACLALLPGPVSAAIGAIRDIKAQSSKAKDHLPVKLRGVVTALSGWNNSFFLQDATEAISVDRLDQTPGLKPGDQIEVSGSTAEGLFAPIVISRQVRILGHAPLPAAREFDLRSLLTGEQDSRRVAVRGIVRSAAIETIWGRPVLYLHLDMGAGEAGVHVLSVPSSFNQLVDAEVRIDGVCGTNFNDAGQIVGIRIFVPDLGAIMVEKPSDVDPFNLPVRSIKSLLRYDHAPLLNHRIRVRGVATFQDLGKQLFIQDGDRGLAIQSAQMTPVRPGSRVDVAGFLGHEGFAPVLTDAVYRVTEDELQIKPAPVDAAQFLTERNGFKVAPYNGQLIRTTGELVEQVDSGIVETFLWRNGTAMFTSRVRKEAQWWNDSPTLAPGSVAIITGVCTVIADGAGDPTAVEVLMRSAADLRVISTPSWWNIEHTRWTLEATASISIFIVCVNFTLRRRMRRQFRLLTDSQTNYQCIVETANDAFIEIDADGSVVEWNRSAESTFGWRRAEVFGKDLAETIVPESFRSAHRRGMKRFIEARRRSLANQPIETMALRKDGAVIPIELTIWAVETSRGIRFNAFVRDISRRKEAEDRLKQSEGLKRQILESSPDCIKVLDLDGRLLSMNAGGCRAMDVESVEPLLSRYWPDLWPEPGRALAEQAILAARRGEEASFCGVCPTMKGTPKWWDVRVTAILNSHSEPERLLAISRDITAQKTAEVAASEVQRRLDLALTGAHIGPWTWDLAEDRVTCHENCAALFGLGRRVFVANSEFFLKRIHPEDRPRVEQQIATALSSGHYETEYRVIWPDGSVYVLAACGEVSQSAGATPSQLVGICWDITSRKEAELALQESELKLKDSHDQMERRVAERTAALEGEIKQRETSELRFRESERYFRQLADAMPQIVWTSRPDGALDYYNERWYSFTGFDRSLTGDQSWKPLLHPDDVQKCLEVWYTSVGSGVPYEIEYRFWDRETEQFRWHLGRALPVHNEAGEIVRWFGTCTDIDDYKRATAELERLNDELEQRIEDRSTQLAETERRYRLLIEGVKDYAILMLNTEGRITSWNDGAERITQYSADEVVGRHFSVFYPPDLAQAGYPERELEFAIAEGQYREEGWRVRRDGSRFWAGILVTAVMDSHGELRGFSKIVRDLTENKAAEQSLIAAQQHADEANRAKTDFLAAMSHEIRTPMNAILGMADLLWETQLDPTQKRYVQVFRRAGGNLLTLVNDILDLAKIESGHFELERIEFDLEELVERTVEMIRPKTQAKGLELLVRITPGTPTHLIGDPIRVQQVLLNLLGNAAKFTENGHVALTIETEEPVPGRLHFVISDTGIGIPADKLDFIFQDFVQAETSTTRRFGGTGLGLGISRRLVERMGGTLRVNSEFGKGSTFAFHATFVVSDRNTAADFLPNTSLVNRKVLVVDDNPTNRLIFAETCASWQMLTVECGTASAALSLIEDFERKRQPFDMVIVDRRLPDADGLAWAGRLRQRFPELRIVIVSSDDEPGHATRSKELGLCGYAVKPVRRSDLLRLLCQALAASRENEKPMAPVESFPIAEPACAQQFRILVVDDSEDNRFLIQAYLKGSPYEVVFAENGLEAVQAFSSQNFDLVLMDILMPVMDGLAATQAIRKQEVAAGQLPCPIIALTANARDEDIERCEMAGCTAHLSKPIGKQKLIGALQRHLQKPALIVSIPEGLESAARRYIQSRQSETKEMNQLLARRDFERLRLLAHNMKGTGTPYGFPGLTQIGADLENAATQQDSSPIREQIALLARYLDQVMGILD